MPGNLAILKDYLLKHKRQLIAGFVALLFTNIFALLVPYVLRYTIDSLKAAVRGEMVIRYALLIISISVVAGIFRYLVRRKLIGVALAVEYELRNTLFGHLQKLSLSYFNKMRTGDIMARATNDLRAVRMCLGAGIMQLSNAVILGPIAITLMIRIDPKLALYSLIPLPILAICATFVSSKIFNRFKRVQEQFSSISAKAQENLTGIRVVKAYAQEENEISSFEQLNQDYLDRNMSLVKIWGLFFPFMMLIASIGIVIVLWLGGRQVIANRITLGQFVQFNSYLMMLTRPMMALGWAVNLVQRGSASMGRLMEIVNQLPEIKDGKDTQPIRTIQGEIEFRNVNFAYNHKRVLKNINLKIDRGQTVAIVGPTGAGKTTLINLISRLLDTTEGQVTIDGVDIRKIPLEVLRRNIGYVPQETFLFSETIKENITYGLEGFDDSQIREAATVSRLVNDIEDFPQGYDTVVGERGVTLSGGQKQRTALSRAIIREPKILILDDALSSVDTYTEEEILKELREFMRSRTSILVSHRISAVREADLIVVLKDGQIAEQGTHDELLALGGIYANMYHEQQLLEEIASI